MIVNDWLKLVKEFIKQEEKADNEHKKKNGNGTKYLTDEDKRTPGRIAIHC